jgi:hypothetical protein
MIEKKGSSREEMISFLERMTVNARNLEDNISRLREKLASDE